MIYPQNGILFCHKNEALTHTPVGPQKHHAESKNPDTKDPVLYEFH